MTTPPSFLGCLSLLISACVMAYAPAASADEHPVGIHVQSKRASEEECKAGEEEMPKHCKRGRFILKAGFKPDEQWIAGASIEKKGLFGSDHQLSLSSELSGLRQEFRTDYDVPTLFGSELDFHAEAFTRKLAYRHFEQENTGVAMRLSRNLSPNLRAFAGYRIQHAETKGIDRGTSGANAIHDAVNEAGIIAALEIGLRYDDREANRMGSTASLFVSRSDRRLGSDYELGRIAAKISHSTPLIGPLSLDLRGYGESVLGRFGERIPLAERLQWSGHADVRGYGLDSAGLALGGELKAGGQAELNFPLVSKWGLSGALFYDAGLIANRDKLALNQLTLRQSVGAGLRWKSPIGPVGVDFALPLGDPQAKPAVLFSIGNSF